MTLLVRARELAQRKSIVAALAIIPLSASTSSAITYMQPGASGGAWVGFGGVFNTAGIGSYSNVAHSDGAIAYSANLGITGATYSSLSAQHQSSDLTFNWWAIAGNPAPGERFNLYYLFNIALQPGSSQHTGAVQWSLSGHVGNTFPTISGSIGPASTPLSQDFTGTQSNSFLNPTFSFNEQTTLDIHWTGFDPDSTLTVNVPPNATIDEWIAVPEPASIGVVGVTAMGLLMRRRRRDSIHR